MLVFPKSKKHNSKIINSVGCACECLCVCVCLFRSVYCAVDVILVNERLIVNSKIKCVSKLICLLIVYSVINWLIVRLFMYNRTF